MERVRLRGERVCLEKKPERVRMPERKRKKAKANRMLLTEEKVANLQAKPRDYLLVTRRCATCMFKCYHPGERPTG